MAFNLTRAVGTIAATGLARAATATIRRKLVAVPARIARRSHRLVLHLPENWTWEPHWSRLVDHTHSPPAPFAACPPVEHPPARDDNNSWNNQTTA